MKTLDVVAAIIHKEGSILATQRGSGQFSGGWEFPGGKIEPRETPEEAVVREIEEELQATVAVERLITVVDYDYDTFHLHMRCYLCHVEDGKLTLSEHSAAKWVDGDSIESVDWLPADKLVVKSIIDQRLLD